MKKIFKEWKWTALILFGIIALAFVTRIVNLTILPVFADEAIYIRWSQIMGNEPTLRFLPLSDGKQPLYMWVLMFFVNRFNDPLFVGRLLSTLTGIGTIAGVFSLTYVLFKNKLVSLLSSFIWAISPYSVFFDRMALVDSMLVMFGIWTSIFGILTAKTLRLDYAMLAGISLGLASLTKSPFIFFALLLPFCFLVSGRKFKEVYKFGYLLLPSYFIAFIMYNIQRLGPNFNLLTSRTKDYVFPISHLWLNPKDPFIPHFDRAIEWIQIMGPWPILILVLLGILAGFKKYRNEIIFLFSWWAVPTLIQSEYAKVFTARYELFTLPFLFSIASLSILAKNRMVKALAVVFFAVFTVLSGIFNFKLITAPEKSNLPRSEKSGYLEEWTAGHGIKEIVGYLENLQNENPDQKIVAGTEGYFGTLPDGLQMYLTDYPQITVIGVGLDITKLPESLIESKQAGNKTFLVVNKSRISKDPEALGLKLIAEYPKSPRPEFVREYSTKGPQEFLYFFEVMR